MRSLRITSELLRRMLDHCRAAYPNEACGILAGSGDAVSRVFCMTNIDPSPVSYFMDPGEQFRVVREMRAAGLRQIGLFHSHPESPAFPSPKDVALAFYEDAVYVIVGLPAPHRPEVRAFEIIDGRVSDAAIVIAD